MNDESRVGVQLSSYLFFSAAGSTLTFGHHELVLQQCGRYCDVYLQRATLG